MVAATAEQPAAAGVDRPIESSDTFSYESTGPDEDVIRVRGNTSVQNLASAVSNAVYDSKVVVLRAIGAGAVNQAVKAVAVARGFTASRGIDIAFVPGFDTVRMPDKNVSAITLRVTILR